MSQHFSPIEEDISVKAIQFVETLDKQFFSKAKSFNILSFGGLFAFEKNPTEAI